MYSVELRDTVREKSVAVYKFNTREAAEEFAKMSNARNEIARIWIIPQRVK